MEVGSRLRRAVVAATLSALAALALAGGAAAEGSFVIGNESAVQGSEVTYWGAQWWKLNSLSGGTAPASFKGFADTAAPACGEAWTTRPGNSSEPPEAPLPALIEVAVSSTVTKHGPTIAGDTKAVALVLTNPGYGPNPGHAGTGTVLGFVCSSHEGGGGEEPS
jgi:hypothetical protein